MEGTWWSLLPFLLIIPLAVWLKEILPGLVAGLLVGTFCLEWSAVGAIERAVSAVLHALTDPEHMKVAAFLYLFGSLVGIMQITGGIKGFVERLSARIRSKRGILLFVWLTVPVTFFMPMFRIMLLGPVMKAVLRQFRIDRRRMAYMIDVSTEPIIVLLPAATAFVGFMTSVVAAALAQNDIHESPYDVFLRSLPYNLFAIVALAVGVLTMMLNIRIGKPRAKKGEGETNTLHGLGLRKELALINGEPLHLFVPLALLIALTFAFFVYDGRKRGAENWWEAFSAADATWAMLLALFVTILLSMMFYLWRRQSLSELTYHFFAGGNELMAPIGMLVLVWAVSAVAGELGFAEYVSSTFGTWLPGAFVPAAVFLVGSFLSYFIGSSWGTWGILMPLGVTLSHATGAPLEVTVGAVFASGTFGAFASPLGDTTITTAAIMDMDLMSYAKYKLRISLLCAGVSLAGYVLLPLWMP
ncbi:na+/H+ antiporter family protein [Geobacillus kaustophilus]|uniref:Na+/H+ antiporter family protein n=1 Tax=Geobacillus kaustophilus TaxID=1462 RepID=A0A0D8BNE9_GEOKU|nr:Na+/H+ antiporter NhaC family protein [Geobacillus kaustophilus]KJE25703.1 na+/H+ antiporter family protein [Geobacillus kaustophilus]